MNNNNHHTLRGLAVAALAVCLLATHSCPAQAQGAPLFELVTAAEAQQAARSEADTPSRPRTRAMPRPNATAIRVVTPGGADTPVPAPLRIELAFKPAPGARIVPTSFRVFYGLLKIDLTDRLKPHATLSESGVVVDGAQVPDGLHRLTVQVADDQGATAEQELLIRVGRAR